MMHLLPWILMATTTSGGGSAPSRPEWKQVFAGGDARGFSAVEATGRDDWVAAGAWGVVTARQSVVKIEPTRANGVLGLFTESPTSIYALGEGELIWHFDGQRWIEEHIAPLPPRGRGPFAEHMLYRAYYARSEPQGPLVAHGLSLALIRRLDGTWTPPPAADRQRLVDAGLRGPRIALPANCERAGWSWFGEHRGAVRCHDRRIFIWDSGGLTPKGKLPPRCHEAVNSLVEVKGELYAACQSLTLWKTEGETWRAIQPPRERGLKELRAVSVADGCLFVTGAKTIWRACGM